MNDLSEEDAILKEEVDFHTRWLKERELTEKIAYPLLVYHQIRDCQRAFNMGDPMLIESTVVTLLNCVPPDYLDSYPEIKEAIDNAKYTRKVAQMVKVKTNVRFTYRKQIVEVEEMDFRQVFMCLMNLFFKLRLLPQFTRKEVV